MHSSSRRGRGFYAAVIAILALVVGMFGFVGPATAAGTHTVTVNVTGSDPGGVGDLRVYLYPASGSSVAKSTDANGQAVFTGVPEGDTEVYVYDNRDNDAYNSYDDYFTVGAADATRNIALTAHFRCFGTSTAVGTYVQGNTLTAQGTSAVNGTATDVYYDWYRLNVTPTGIDSTEVQGSTSPTYTLTQYDVGHQVVVYVYYYDASNNEADCESQTATPVIAAPGTPVSAPPVVTGKAKVGKKLTANPGASGTGAALSYQWVRIAKHGKSVKAIKGADGQRYKLKGADRGKRVGVIVTYTRPGYTPSSVLSNSKKIK